MIWIEGVPVERVLDLRLLHLRRDRVGAVWPLLAVDGHTNIDRSVGRDHYVAGTNFVS